MKKAILIISLLVYSVFTYGQDLSFSLSPTLNNVLYYRFVAGGPIRSAKFGVNSSIGYEFINNNRVSLGFGISYQYSQVEIAPSFDPIIERIFHTESVNLISVSFKTIYKLKKEYYFSLDPLLDIQLKSDSQKAIDNQTGLGLSFAAGKKILIKDSFYVRIEPRIWVHNIVPFIDNNLPLRLTVVGINIGVGLRKQTILCTIE